MFNKLADYQKLYPYNEARALELGKDEQMIYSFVCYCLFRCYVLKAVRPDKNSPSTSLSTGRVDLAVGEFVLDEVFPGANQPFYQWHELL